MIPSTFIFKMNNQGKDEKALSRVRGKADSDGRNFGNETGRVVYVCDVFFIVELSCPCVPCMWFSSSSQQTEVFHGLFCDLENGMK